VQRRPEDRGDFLHALDHLSADGGRVPVFAACRAILIASADNPYCCSAFSAFSM
jgi:hypothetical protein